MKDMTGMIERGENRAIPADQQAFGDYLLLERVGTGPVGATYRALDRRDGRRVVLRLADAEAPEGAALGREAKLLRGLRHQNLVQLLDSGERDGRAFSILADEDGITLDRLPAAWRASIGQRTLVELLAPLLSALEAVHRAGALHGDISPRNILLRRDGTPLLLDFASAVDLEGREADDKAAAATPGFTAPERGDPARQGPGSDLFALAAVVHWLIVGHPLETTAGYTAAGFAPFSKAAGGDKRFSPSFLKAVDAALAPAIGDRPDSAAEWRKILLDAGPAERADAPSLAELSGVSRKVAEIDLPPADEVPPTVLLQPEERRRAAHLAGRAPVLRSDALVAEARLRPRGRAPRLVLAVALIILASGGAAAGWWGWTWYRDASKLDWLVDAAGGGDTATLAEAIARAPDGATISIRAGVYAESLVIERPVHLRAAGEVAEGDVVISPAGGRCLLLDAPSGSLQGLAFEGGDGGPCLEVESGAMEITGNRLGPWAGSALLVRDGAAPLIRDNHFLDIEGSALVFDEGGGGTVAGNKIERTAKSAIRVGAGADPMVRDNEISEAGQAGLLIEQGAGGVYAGNRILGPLGSGIEVRGGAAPSVQANRIEDAGQAGLFIHEGAKGEYLDNQILRSKLAGIVVTGGAAPLVTGNEIADGEQHGLLVLGGAGGRFADNKIHGNKGHGVVLGGGQEADLGENEMEGNRKPQVRRMTQ
jgi:Protein kinase domain/Right handed beta helix region